MLKKEIPFVKPRLVHKWFYRSRITASKVSDSFLDLIYAIFGAKFSNFAAIMFSKKILIFGMDRPIGVDYLRWLNRVMQDHEARASDLNRKLIFSFFLLFS